MKLSIFTPTHKPVHIGETFNSLLRQDWPDWEWVIVLNNGACRDDIPPAVLAAVDEGRVRILDGPAVTAIGALKRFACHQCRGDVFIELDHDDMLIPGALSRIAQAAVDSPRAFIYSDAAVFEDGPVEKSWGYNRDWGWEHYPVRVYGRTLVATQTFPVTPRSLCEVYVAPDHVRAWTRQAYERVGGHNVTLDVCDDHDLICRTYLAGIPFVKLDGCQYLYRWHPGNTIKERQTRIQEQNTQNRRKYLPQLITEWCNRSELSIRRHDCQQPPASWTSGPAVGHIRSFNQLQFLHEHERVPFFNSAFEALVPGGYLTVTVPSTKGRGADQHPLTRSRWNENSFRYYTDSRFAHELADVTCRFQLVDVHEFYPDNFHRVHDMLMLRVILCALKGQRQPGPVHI